ncbi:MAG: D-glycero-beta-D-manno-heptose 1,7-bisphosphate 7-phosphatase [Caldilinea sp.]|nr:D-glycero-beta-D-manno-heptose 1,7-bisphosphate 7-phosphatase [Caldilinea sp.]MCB0056345.1 D-glycero-beta-D-manno-heptose 1,7-bisphosphate 7-phosphatase [Caldilineaceae bacterium]MCB0038312.1 D-glycero-beta-D-manno-heptose 1,7-bisphosphate 7-phosphatase [Caldilinea sp.]MCB0050379.1 D-glycero-beta-D-manno-heptose 1,7-bisphosphate 7-phosphatase [Caldilinea sp.]MCB0068427.1 D-glycero-beta-D-manno-heptose 1,7-bisphosphate 7-phosphatase [Caldilineaceae bacterium]
MGFDAIFVDRDGTINVERSDYVKSLDEFEYLPGAVEALARLGQLNIPVIIVTNQSAIGRGIASAARIDEIHAALAARVYEAGGRLDAVYVCPHHPEARCSCRKPKPGMLLAAATRFGLLLHRCAFIGDSVTDLGVAKAAGCKPFLVRTGLHAQEVTELAKVDSSVVIADDLTDAVSLILTKATIPVTDCSSITADVA